jgi:hypothetical protein
MTSIFQPITMKKIYLMNDWVYLLLDFEWNWQSKIDLYQKHDTDTFVVKFTLLYNTESIVSSTSYLLICFYTLMRQTYSNGVSSIKVEY